MKTMEPTEGTIHTDQRITQVDIGALEVTTMAYSTFSTSILSHFSTLSQSIAFCHEITVRAWYPGASGWGTIIFEGSLEDLIKLIKKAETQEEVNSNGAGNKHRQ